jgi:putative ABC transport system permease protein
MTVTKAQSAPKAGSSQGPSFKFGATSSSSSSQSSDRVNTQGGQALASSLVTKVASQKGVSTAVGALTLNVTKVDGSFTQGKAKSSTSSGSSSSQQGGPGGGTNSGSTGQPQVQGGGANFNVNSYSVAGIDVTDQTLGPLSTSKITTGKTFTTAQTNAKVAVVSKSYAKTKKYKASRRPTAASPRSTCTCR